MSSDFERDLLNRARREVRRSDAPLLLAVSGGLDSMVLLDVVTRIAADRIAGVATFDHGTGAHSARAVAHVAREAGRRGHVVVSARMTRGATERPSEAAWRTERLAFLRAAASACGARIATAHTRDDQIETVLMRIMRGSGARGLAALAATSAIARPLLTSSRRSLERYAQARDLQWVDDPSNRSLAHVRNRVRLELLPALRTVDPAIDDALWSIGERAARWRADVEALVDDCLRVRQRAPGALAVGAAELEGQPPDSLGVLWGALAGRLGLALDRRGTQRCAAFTTKRPRRGSIPLSGGWRLEASGERFVLRQVTEGTAGASTLPERGSLHWGAFRFAATDAPAGEASWSAAIEGSERITVRRWRAGDRLAPSRGQGRRRVARYLSDARVTGSEREGWPVVMKGDDVVWIPGVRRADAATARSGRPIRHYICEWARG
ncbi:MAG TPA: tRNA lysidine(34) synthetase TilS [Gemmatimonadaceae bacterium]|nr:tRNA lysidine(34) synthetase TilS [Gemmatimonadaceae bacterium]